MFTTKNMQPDFDELTSREWIVTNGIGGYASSSIIGANTRRYHGLLVASLNPPTERTAVPTQPYGDGAVAVTTMPYSS